MTNLMLIIIVVCTYICGVISGITMKKKQEVVGGKLVINTSDPSKELFELHFNQDVNLLSDKKDVIFKVFKE